MPISVYTLTFASGATGTNKVFVEAGSRVAIIASALTAYNAGTGNATIQLRAGLSTTDTHGIIQSCTIATAAVDKGVYPMPYPVPTNYMSVGFGTAVTGSAANTIDVAVFTER
jgi:hypothetical protein